MKLKVGIFFGGPSREREISFAGGRTVYDNLNRSLFEPVPIFVDSHQNWILLDWQYIYKGTIRDFFPPVSALTEHSNEFQIYQESLGQLSAETQQEIISEVGVIIPKNQIATHIDLAFLALHGVYGEDGQIQQELTDLDIPYTGCGIRASQIGMDKAWQKELMTEKGFPCPTVKVLSRSEWLQSNVHDLYAEAGQTIAFPMVVRPANQGSSIGVSIINEKDGLEAFELAINRAFFRDLIPLEEWHDRSDFDKLEYVRLIGDIREGLGFPVTVTLGGLEQTIYSPEVLLQFLNEQTANAEYLSQLFVLEAHQDEKKVILESFIHGKEFSCIVVRAEDGSAIALPPTEIIKGAEIFDYRSKYMPGLTRKETPINLEDQQIEKIRRECERLFTKLDFQVYARIDGFFTADETVFLNDPNTTSGMLPSSFFFHQAAEIGLNPSQFLTFIIRISLQERLKERTDNLALAAQIQQLDQTIIGLHSSAENQQRIAVVLGGYSTERHISVESGRNVFEKLASSDKYEPFPVFLTGNAKQYQLFQIPVNLLLKDNADDIRDKIKHWATHSLLEKIRLECRAITEKYASQAVVFHPQSLSHTELQQKADGVFVALHGRPGEDGKFQQELDVLRLPYNGSGVKSSATTIDKFRTLQLLSKHGLPVAQQLLLSARDFEIDEHGFFNKIEQNLTYPLIAKPVDDGCSSAVKLIHNREDLEAYTRLIFGLAADEAKLRQVLKLKNKEEFPRKQEILFEERIVRGDALHFLEITGGLLTHYDQQGHKVFEMFEPSEALASGEVLSLEEKFLAGEGQNLTPARLGVGEISYESVLKQVQQTLERVANLVGTEGYSRIDAFVKVYPDGKAKTYVIEVNSLPGMTPATAIFHQAALAGYTPAAFIDKILMYGAERQRRITGELTIADSASAAQATTELSEIPTAKTKNEPDFPIKPTNTMEIEEPTEEPAMESPQEAPQKEPAFGLPFNDAKAEQHPAVAAPLTRWGHIKNFLSSGYLWKNIGAMAAFLVVGFILLNIFLNVYTDHGDSVQVDNYVGLTIEEATKKARSRGFEVSLDQGLYDNKIPADQIIEQKPVSLSRIKENRTIYLTTIGPERPRELPTWESVGYDWEKYEPLLKRMQFSTAIRDTIFDAVQDPGSIVSLHVKGKKYTENDIKRGVEIIQGETVEAVITKNRSNEVQVASLVCKRYSEVAFALSSVNLKIGTVTGNVSDRDNAYVWKQEPAPGTTRTKGSAINIFIQQGLPAGCDPPVEATILEDDGFGDEDDISIDTLQKSNDG